MKFFLRANKEEEGNYDTNKVKKNRSRVYITFHLNYL